MRGSREAVARDRLGLVERLDGHRRVIPTGGSHGHAQLEWATLEATSSRIPRHREGDQGTGLSLWESRTAQSRQARPGEAQGPSSVTAKGGALLDHAGARPRSRHPSRSASRSPGAARRVRDASSPAPGSPRASRSAQLPARVQQPVSSRHTPSDGAARMRVQAGWGACSREPSLFSCAVSMLVPERFDARLDNER